MKLGIVVPCYNEEAVLPETGRRMLSLVARLVAAGKIAPDSKIYFVDDGSTDRTWAVITQLADADRHVAGIRLSRNRGHQNALMAGLLTARGDALVSIDADLQDDIDAIEEMIDRAREGAEIVYGVRKQRETDTAFKRVTAQAFYKLIDWLGAESVYNHADYRLMSRRAVECLKQYREVNLFLRGIVPLIGFRSEIVYYRRAQRMAGESKYPLRRMVGLALDAITSFSVVPLRMITFAGFVIFVGSMLVTLWVVWVRFFTDTAVPGWASVVLPMYFLGGIQIFCIGMLGEYLGKIYGEVKSRPRYFIERTIAMSDDPGSVPASTPRGAEARLPDPHL
jgi:glycosyltransferase involved in cell wall biosynthesis